MTRVFQLRNSSEGYLAHVYRFIRPHVIVNILPTWEAWDVLDLLKAGSFGKLEIISIVGWLGIILMKGFSFVVPIIAANSLPWVWQGCLRSNLSAGKTSFCDRIIHIPATKHMIVYYLSTINSTESLEYLESLN